MQLRILGCSGGIGDGLRTTSYLVNGTILIDGGTGIGDLTLEEMARIRHVFLTHAHLDHIAGLPLLVDTIFHALKTPLIVHAQPASIESLKAHIFGLEFRMIPVDHTVPSMAIRVSDGEGSFCFSGDTGITESLWAGLNEEDGLDFLLMECAFPNEHEELARISKHYWPTQLAKDLKKLKHRPRVGITHLKPGGEADTWRQCQEEIEGFDILKVEHGQVFDIGRPPQAT